MSNSRAIDQLSKKIQNALKLGGFSVRSELCKLLVEEATSKKVDLGVKETFVSFIENLSSSLENQCCAGHSIEREHIIKAVETCLNVGYEQNEVAFSVINAFDFPKFHYDMDRKQYYMTRKKSKLLSEASSKSILFIERYEAVLLKTRRYFLKTVNEDERDRLKLQTVDFLLTLSHIQLEKTLILGSLFQASEGKYYLEDPTGIVQLDLTHAKFAGGFFVENSFVLVNGLYEDKILTVSSMMVPPVEQYEESRPSFGNLNYFGGTSKLPLRDSRDLSQITEKFIDGLMFFFSDVWLDHHLVFEKLKAIFDVYEDNPPIAFVFLGNFISESHGSERMDVLKKCFKELGDLICQYAGLVANSQFVFVPGMTDPSTPHIIPRLPLPSHLTEDLRRALPKAIFATNPCRIQYCHREITIFRCDILNKMLQGTLSKPKKENITEFITRTIVGQGHLAPMSLNSQPVHWDFDYTLRLHPLPDLVIIGDNWEGYKETHKGCLVANPGLFRGNTFEFISYNPHLNEVEACSL